MQPTLVLVHTVPPLVSVFQTLVTELLPGVRLFHILDEPMVERVKRRGGLADEDGVRLASTSKQRLPSARMWCWSPAPPSHPWWT